MEEKHNSISQLRAYLDQALTPAQQFTMAEHLQTCPLCQLKLQDLQRRGEWVRGRMEALSPAEQTALASQRAYQRLSSIYVLKERNPMVKKEFWKHYQFLWASLALIIVLGIALAFPSVRAIANSFLGLFRVQEITIVQVDPDSFSGLFRASEQMEALFARDLQVEEIGQVEEVNSAQEASELAGFKVRLPETDQPYARLQVLPAAKAQMQVDLSRIQPLLAEMGYTEIELSQDIDGSIITVSLPRAVVVQVGDCPLGGKETGDPDTSGISSGLACTTWVQMPSPEVNTPAGLDIASLGQAYLQVLGMSPEDAAHFGQQIDWATTFVIPMPLYATTYQDVPVDGVIGTLVLYQAADERTHYMLMWVKEGLVYALSGPGNTTTAVSLAGSLR